MSTGHTIAILAVIFTITYALRSAPYLVFREVEPGSTRYRILSTLQLVMPLGVLSILVVYTLRDIPWTSLSTWGGEGRGIAALLGVVVTAVVHWRWSQPLLTMAGGVATYALLLSVLAQ